MKLKFYQGIPGEKTPWLKNLEHNLFTLFVCAYQWPVVMLHSLLCRSRKHYEHEVGICLIFRNEARFLKEWIEYYLMIGIDHFWLYDNNSEDNFREVLEPYISRGIVTLIDWPQKFAQQAAYRDCHRRTKHSVHWMGYIDADEFVNLHKENNFKDFLRHFRHYPSVNLHWRDFGTSGHLKEEGLCTERYVAAWPYLCHMGKGFLNNDYNFMRVWIHEHWAKWGPIRLYPVSDNKLPVPYAPTLWRNCGIGKRAYLNHYFCRSREWYLYKDKQRGSANAAASNPIKLMAGRFELHELKCTVHDYSIQRWLTLLKERIAITEIGE